ncbi:nucleoporin complex subunit 54-domain-containing protein [Lipomyces oligophaga]|uniref:nucleoporin complex subunit 54-domain-containing protein n=1 Tax=Lipomyces oligophaga TaxID=45792 RepID=UPI0034CDE745
MTQTTGSSLYPTIGAAPSIPDQLGRIKNSWDPNSPDCAFQYCFYNSVTSDQAALYGKPPQVDQARWDAAIANRPDANSVPYFAVGFSALKTRVQFQEQQVVAYRIRMHEIHGKLLELVKRHDLFTTVRVAELKAKHAALEHRSMSLAAKIQVLKNRGYALRPEEEALKRKLEALITRLDDPAVMGKINEVWARMTVTRERIRILSEQARQTGEQWENALDWERDNEQLEKLGRILKGQQLGLIYLADILRNDTNEVDQILRTLEQKAQERTKR